jgi:hypothetical protein
MIAGRRAVATVLVGGAAPGQRAARIDPCAVLTRQDAARLVGASFEPGKVEEKPVVGLSQCIYHEAGKAGGGALAQVGVTQQAAMPAQSKQTPESIFRSIRTEGFPDAPPSPAWGSRPSWPRPERTSCTRAYI